MANNSEGTITEKEIWKELIQEALGRGYKNFFGKRGLEIEFEFDEEFLDHCANVVMLRAETYGDNGASLTLTIDLSKKQ